MARASYNTWQRKAILGCLRDNADRYLSVEGVHDALRASGSEVGRTTVYRALESFAEEGTVAKVPAPCGGETRYRLMGPGHEDSGQLVCVGCGRVIAIGCADFQRFSRHVCDEHGFSIDLSRTVLYGRCEACSKGEGSDGRD